MHRKTLSRLLRKAHSIRTPKARSSRRHSPSTAMLRPNGCSKHSTRSKSASTSFTSGTKRLGQNRNTATGSGVAMGDYDGDGRGGCFFAAIDRRRAAVSQSRRLPFRGCNRKVAASAAGRAVDARRDVRRHRQRRRPRPVRVRLPLPESSVHQSRRRHVRRAEPSSSASTSTAPASSCRLPTTIWTATWTATWSRTTFRRRKRSSIGWCTTSAVCRACRHKYREFHDTAAACPRATTASSKSANTITCIATTATARSPTSASRAGFSGNDKGLAATWWDYNDDGYPDLYVANDFYAPDCLYRNNGDGTFTDVAAEVLPHTPWFSMGMRRGRHQQRRFVRFHGHRHVRAARPIGPRWR